MQPPAFAHHVLTRTLVLPAHRVLFLPIPKAGCTSVLWLLAGLAGLHEDDFAASIAPEASPALTVHDMRVWGPQYRFGELGTAERRRILEADDWLRFTLVRHPGERLWSAWQSKLLLREPRFVEAFGDAPWFPRLPSSPEAVVEDFRRFVAAVGEGAEDVHWAVQSSLTAQLPLTQVGRVERFEETLAVLRAHAGELGAPPHENRTPLPLPPGAYDRVGLGILRRRYGADFVTFGYDDHPGESGFDAWAAEAEPRLPLMRAIAGGHARVEQLHRSVRRLARRAESAEERMVARGGGARAGLQTNREGFTDFTVRWGWADGPLAPGFTAVLRVRDEARALPVVLPPLLRAVRHVVLVDNGSTDGTPGVARRVAAEVGAADRLEVHHYPFAVARCGADHLATPADSVHSLAYFYNWCFAHVRTTYALKWDGDMVLGDAAVDTLRDLAWQLEAADVVLRVPRYPLYLAGERRAFLDTGLRNCEPWGWPNKPGYSFVKALEWELPLWGTDAEPLVLPDRSCVELKHLDADEFAHWTNTDFDRSPRQARKRRELEVFRALTAGSPPPEGVVEIVAPDVVEHVRATWLAGGSTSGAATSSPAASRR